MKLFIANKNYSSWSFRPWLAMKQANIPFEEVLVPFDMAAGNPEFKAFAPHGKVPTLVDDTTTVWESLAIMEYIADQFPDACLWPKDKKQRAMARAISCEMLAGFTALRGAFPMNMRRPPENHPISESVQKDIDRITHIWTECLDQNDGPFLFGGFTIADAMYAPVVSRFHTYGLTRDPKSLEYMANIRSLEHYKNWEEEGRLEPWYVAEDEIDDPIHAT